MLNKKRQAGTKAQQSTNDEVSSSSHTIGKPNVVRSFLSAQDLRIGNIVTDEFYESFKTIIKVESVGHDGVNLLIEDDGNYPELAQNWIQAEYPFDKLRGIPLGDEILRQCGFELKAEKDDVLYTGWYYRFEKEFSMRIWKEEETETFRYSINNFNSIWIKSLHQLQNLYFALTGYELEVSLK